MRLPSTAAANLFLMSPVARFVTTNSSLGVTSVVERISGAAITAPAGALPTWGGASLAGTYSSTNFPGSTGIAGLTFAGAQNLEFDALSANLDGYTSFTVTAVVSCTTPSGSTGQAVWGLGATSATTPTLSLQYKSGTIKLIEVNGNGTFTASAATDSSVHVITAIRANNTLTLRVDGVQVATQAVTLSGDQFNTFCIGGVNSNGAVSLNFTGVMGDVLVCAGSADVQAVEAFLMLSAGLVRTSTAV